METKFQASFIPKQPVTEELQRRGGSGGLVFLVAFLIFALSALAAGGVVVWNKILDTRIATEKETLKVNESALDSNSVREFVRLRDRIDSANKLLQNHLAPSNIFQVLELYTLKRIRFNDFSYAYAGADKVSVTMRGQAEGNDAYEAISTQSKQFTIPKLKNVFKSPIFGDLNFVEASNLVTFTFSTIIDSRLISYYKTIKEGSLINPNVPAAPIAPAPTQPVQPAQQVQTSAPSNAPANAPITNQPANSSRPAAAGENVPPVGANEDVIDLSI